MNFIELASHLQATLPTKGPVLLAIAGGQGCGKSTLAKLLVQKWQAQGHAAAAVSLDDYYLTKAKRQQLAKHIHPALAQRGLPGSHDWRQLQQDLLAFQRGEPVAWAQFDKAIDDRIATKPATIISHLVVEGWCLGLPPVAPSFRQQQPSGLPRVVEQYADAALADYQALFAKLTPLIYLQAPDWTQICQWRWQQEQQLVASRGVGMTQAQCDKFMELFQHFSLWGLHCMPALASQSYRLDPEHCIIR